MRSAASFAQSLILLIPRGLCILRRVVVTEMHWLRRAGKMLYKHQAKALSSVAPCCKLSLTISWGSRRHKNWKHFKFRGLFVPKHLLSLTASHQIRKGKNNAIVWRHCLGDSWYDRPFPSYPKHLFQGNAKCVAVDMKLNVFVFLHSHANKTHFYKKGFAVASFWKWEVLELGNGLLIAL